MRPRRFLSVFTGNSSGRYLTRLHLPRGYKLHVFHRGDADPDPHDHPWDFRTFPLTGYYEEVWVPDPHQPGQLSKSIQYVRPWRWHSRRAEHTHRVLGKQARFTPGKQRIITLVRVDPERREWGFWEEYKFRRGVRRWVHWRAYLGVNAAE